MVKMDKQIDEKMGQIIDYCQSHIPFYAKLLKSQAENQGISTIDDFKRLPFTTKNDLKRNYPYGMAGCSLDQIIGYYETAGDKNEQNRSSRSASFFTNDDLARDISRRTSGTLEFANTDVVFISLPYAYSCAALGYHMAAQKQGAMVISADNESKLNNYRKQLDVLMRINPTIIITAYPFIYSTILKLMGDTTKRFTKLRAIQLCGMPHSSNGMKRISEAFNGVPVYNTYDMVEFGAITACCPEGKKHICDDFYVEIINPKTMEVIKEDGIGGEIVITSLRRQGSPLIRYRTGDIGRIYKNGCQCSSDSPYIQVLGRLKNLIEFKEQGKRFTLCNFEDVFYQHECLTGMYKPKFVDETLTFVIDVESDNKKQVAAEVKRMIRDQLDIDVEIEAVNVGVSRREFLSDSAGNTLGALQSVENKKNEWLITY